LNGYNIVFGKYDLSMNLQTEEFEIEVTGRGKRRTYRRKANNEEVEKIIYADEGNIVICPVEPVNMPKLGVAEHLMVELKKSVIFEPDIKNTFYVKFPLEIGVFTVDKKDVERIDIFTTVKAKYALYGPPESGIICRWWRSDVYADEPEVNPLKEGILRVDVENKYYEWVELKKVVFRAFDMKIFYNEHAYMHGILTLLQKTTGETSFNTRKPKNMHGSIDIYAAKGIKKFDKKYFMEWGFQ